MMRFGVQVFFAKNFVAFFDVIFIEFLL